MEEEASFCDSLEAGTVFIREVGGNGVIVEATNFEEAIVTDVEALFREALVVGTVFIREVGSSSSSSSTSVPYSISTPK